MAAAAGRPGRDLSRGCRAMTSSSRISWLDYSDAERRKVLDIIDLFRDRDTRDELGLGAIRDGLADFFFPGTSTIQTRVGYFLLVPWVYRRIEDRWAGTHGVGERARAEEIRLIDALARSRDTEGLIGRQARRGLKRLPSDVYWSGLRTWGIRTFAGSREQYHRRLEFGPIRAGLDAVPLGEADDPQPVPPSGAWHPNLPSPPVGFPDEAALGLRPEDSQYLSERILASAPGTLLAWLVKDGEPHPTVTFVWRHPQFEVFPADLKHVLNHARSFSEVMIGSALLYNAMLADKKGSEELSDVYRGAIAEWTDELDLGNWDERELWDVLTDRRIQVDPLTRQFVECWLTALADRPGPGLAEDVNARMLIEQREVEVKKSQARLRNDRALAMWGGQAGTAQMDYRWGTAQRHLRDIYRGRDRA
jgi:Family of unknown function (DUF6361)